MVGLVDKIFHCFYVGAVFMIVVVGFAFAWPRYSQARDLEAKHADLMRQIEAKNREISQVRRKQRLFSYDREFVEQLARENRRVFPGELVFIFDER